jgi:hypothetical protein
MTDVVLQHRKNGDVWLNLSCGFNEAGDFVIAGHDLGSDFTYEWWTTVMAADVPALIALLGGSPGDDLLEIMVRDWVPLEGDGLEKLIRESDVPSQFENYHHFD